MAEHSDVEQPSISQWHTHGDAGRIAARSSWGSACGAATDGVRPGRFAFQPPWASDSPPLVAATLCSRGQIAKQLAARKVSAVTCAAPAMVSSYRPYISEFSRGTLAFEHTPANDITR